MSRATGRGSSHQRGDSISCGKRVGRVGREGRETQRAIPSAIARRDPTLASAEPEAQLVRGLGLRLAILFSSRPPGSGRAPAEWFCKADASLQRAGYLHEAIRPHGSAAAAAAAADPGGGGGGGDRGELSEPGGPSLLAPVDALLGSGPWAGAEAARGFGARGGGRGRGPEAAAQEEAEEGGRAEPGRQAAQSRRRRRLSPGLAMLLASAVVVWEWLNEHGRWRPYSPAVSHHIEAVVRAGPRAGGSVVLGQVDSRLAPYIIDLQSMNQFRQDTGELAAPAPPAPTSPPCPEISRLASPRGPTQSARPCSGVTKRYSGRGRFTPHDPIKIPPATNVHASSINVLVMQTELLPSS